MTVALLALAARGATHAMHPGTLGAAFAARAPPWLAAARLYALAHTVSGMVRKVGVGADGCAGVVRRHVLVTHWTARGARELVPGRLGDAPRLTVLHPPAAAVGDPASPGA